MSRHRALASCLGMISAQAPLRVCRARKRFKLFQIKQARTDLSTSSVCHRMLLARRGEARSRHHLRALASLDWPAIARSSPRAGGESRLSMPAWIVPMRRQKTKPRRPNPAFTVSAGYDHRGADRNAAVEIGNVGVEHADAAVGDEAADGARHVGAVDGVLPAGKRHRRHAHGVLR